eukprot:gene5810-16938_t
MASAPKAMLLTSNVGSIFEQPILMPGWAAEVGAAAERNKVKFLALHLQEVGGKSTTSSVPAIHKLIKLLEKTPGLKEFSAVAGWLDTVGSDISVYTALGVIYFVHKSLVGSTERYNHKQRKYTKLEDGNHVV